MGAVRSAKLKAVPVFLHWILDCVLLQIIMYLSCLDHSHPPQLVFLNAAAVFQVATTAEIQKVVPRCA